MRISLPMSLLSPVFSEKLSCVFAKNNSLFNCSSTAGLRSAWLQWWLLLFRC